jgi:hypothetical protein
MPLLASLGLLFLVEVFVLVVEIYTYIHLN